jgi:hypothetical protein
MEHAVLPEKKSDMSRPSETRDAIQIGKHFFLQNSPGSISDKCGLPYTCKSSDFPAMFFHGIL